MEQIELPMRQRRILQQNNLQKILRQLVTITTQIDSLKQLSKSITGKNIPKSFMYNIGGVFVKEKGDKYYKTIENEISNRMIKKKELKNESYRVIALIVSLTTKQDEKFLSPLTAQAIDEYREELQDLNDMN